MQQTTPDRFDIPDADQLDAIDQEIITRRLVGQPVPEIAAAVNRSCDAVWRRLRRPIVRNTLANARCAQLYPLFKQSMDEMIPTVLKIVEIRDAADSPRAIQLQAAKQLQEWFQRMLEVAELDPRLAEVERFADEQRQLAAEQKQAGATRQEGDG